MGLELDPDLRCVGVLLTELELTDDRVQSAATSRVKRSEGQAIESRESEVRLSYLDQDRARHPGSDKMLDQNEYDKGELHRAPKVFAEESSIGGVDSPRVKSTIKLET